VEGKGEGQRGANVPGIESMAAASVKAAWPSSLDLRVWLLPASAAVAAATKASQLLHAQPRKPKHHHNACHTPAGVWVTTRLASRGYWCANNKETMQAEESHCMVSIWALPAIGRHIDSK